MPVVSFTNLPIENLNVDLTKEIDQEKLDLDINDFINNDVILIHSGTATGKTRNIARITNDLKKATNCNILSVVNLVSLATEQIHTFNDEGNVELLDYRKKLKKFYQNDGVICINSLHKLSNVNENSCNKDNGCDFKNTILYIDECNDLIQTITQNATLELRPVYDKLKQLIKSCKKIILSDATINQNTMNLLMSRIENKKIIHIKNKFKKYNGVPAMRYNDENEFLKKLDDYVKDDKYFLFGCDSCRKLTTIFNDLVQKNELKKSSFVLITSETAYRPKDASKEFKDKFVFYSPSITTGVSFAFKDVKQAQFIYMTNNPLITPASFYQMSCRTRNMSELNYYSDDPKPREMKLKTLEEIETKNKSLTDAHEKILSLSRSTDEFDNDKIVCNSFFKMYCYREYEDSIFWTGYLQHYQDFLTKSGFVLESIGESKKLNKTKSIEMKGDYIEFREAQFTDYIEHYENGDDGEGSELTDEIQQDVKMDIFSIYDKRRSLLRIINTDDLKKYQNFICCEYSLTYYFDFLKLLRTNDYVLECLGIKAKKSFSLAMINNSYNKMNLLIQFEKHYKIKRFGIDPDNIVLKKIKADKTLKVENVDEGEVLCDDVELYEPILMEFNGIDDTKVISEDFQLLCKNAFSARKSDKFQYDSKYELKKTYVNMIKNICGDLKVITQKQVRVNKSREYQYYLNINEVIRLVELLSISNSSFQNMDAVLIEKLTKIKPIKKSVIELIIDEDESFEKYHFGKNQMKA